MSAIRDHMNGKQFPDDPPMRKEDMALLPSRSLARFTGGWVAAGQPRWRAYAIYWTSIVAGIAMLIPLPGEDGSLFAVIGVFMLFFGIGGTIETVIGRRLWRPR